MIVGTLHIHCFSRFQSTDLSRVPSRATCQTRPGAAWPVVATDRNLSPITPPTSRISFSPTRALILQMKELCWVSLTLPLLLACAAAAFTANVPRVIPRTSASPLRLQSGALQSCAAESGAAQSSGPLSPHRSPLRLVEQRLPLGEPSEYEQVICFLSLLDSPPPPPFSHMSHTRFSHTSRMNRPQELRSLP